MNRWQWGVLLLIAVGDLLIVACTDQSVARNWGGAASVEVPCDQVLFDVTWKEDSLWYATSPARAGWEPQVYTYHESSSFGLVQGTVTFTEHRCP